MRSGSFVEKTEGCGPDWTFDLVQERLIEAYGVLRRLPDPDAKNLRVKTMSLWDQVSVTAGMNAAEQAEYRLYRAGDPPRAPGVSRGEHDRMEEALSWLLWIKPDIRPIVHIAIEQLWRGNARIDWTATGADPRVSGSFDRARMAYRRSVTAIARKLAKHATR